MENFRVQTMSQLLVITIAYDGKMGKYGLYSTRSGHDHGGIPLSYHVSYADALIEVADLYPNVTSGENPDEFLAQVGP